MRRLTLPLLLVAALTFLVGLGRGAITDSDEAFYAESAREMVESGDWITPYFNYQPRFQKPILYYWLSAATYLVTGPSEAAARFWAALSGIGLVLVTAACARRWYDDGTGLLAGAITATSFGYYAIGRVALPDLPLAFFITLAIWSGWVALLERAASRTRWVVVMAAALALGFLTKGPVGVIIPLMVVVPIVLIERRSLDVGGRDVLVGALVFCAIALPWYLVMYSRHGAAYVEGFFIGDNLERYTTDRFNDPRGWWFYAPVVLGGLLPWTPLMLTWVQPIADVVRRRRGIGTLELRLVLWAGLPLLFYSLSVGKQPRYVLPVLPPLAILLATSILERTRDWRSLDGSRVPLRRPPSITMGALLSGGGLIALAVLLWRARPLLINVAPALTTAAAMTIALAGGAVIAVVLSRSWRRTPVALTIAAAITFPALQFGALSGTGDDTVQRMARHVLDARADGEPIGTSRVFVRNLVFYTGIETVDLINDDLLAEFLAQPQRVLVVAPASTISEFERTRGTTLRRLAEVPYFNEAGIRLRTLLWPDPAMHVTSVVLVANR